MMCRYAYTHMCLRIALHCSPVPSSSTISTFCWHRSESESAELAPDGLYTLTVNTSHTAPCGSKGQSRGWESQREEGLFCWHVRVVQQ
jgi:hypothetical protein